MATLDDSVRAELLSRLEHFALAPRCAIDLGGVDARALKRRFPRAAVIEVVPAGAPARRSGWWRPVRRVCADGTQLPVADACADLVLARIPEMADVQFDGTLTELIRVLSPTGLLLLAASAGDPQALGSALARAGFIEPVLDVERFGSTADRGARETIVFAAAFGRTTRPDTMPSEVSVPLSRVGRRTNSLT